jgi:hypothetical protein
MRKLLFAAAALMTTVTLAPAAHAVQTISFTPPAADGSFSGAFSNVGVASPSFTDVFNFTFPTAGIVNGTISSSFTAANNNIDFTSVTLNGKAFDLVSFGKFEYRELADTLFAGGPQTLIVSGTAGTAATYSGTLSFTSAVPEPATWAMMIGGFAAVGVAIRRRRSTSIAKLATA